jgi:hypothetical protein
MTTAKKVISLDPGAGVIESGFPIGDLFFRIQPHHCIPDLARRQQRRHGAVCGGWFDGLVSHEFQSGAGKRHCVVAQSAT